MDYRQFGSSGLRVPVLSFGTGTFGGTGPLFGAWGTSDVAEARRLIDICLEAGVNLFDTADVYSDGASERVLGEAVKGRRDQVLISTKTGLPTGDGPGDWGVSRGRLIASVEAALKRLGTDHIDLLQLHAFDASTPAEELLATLATLVTSGKVRYTDLPVGRRSGTGMAHWPRPCPLSALGHFALAVCLRRRGAGRHVAVRAVDPGRRRRGAGLGDAGGRQDPSTHPGLGRAQGRQRRRADGPRRMHPRRSRTTPSRNDGPPSQSRDRRHPVGQRARPRHADAVVVELQRAGS